MSAEGFWSWYRFFIKVNSGRTAPYGKQSQSVGGGYGAERREQKAQTASGVCGTRAELPEAGGGFPTP